MTPLQRDDYLQRQIRAIAAIMARVAGLRLSGEIEEARLELERAYREHLGPRGEVIRRIDARTAAQLLGSRDAIRTLADLADEESALESDATRREVLRRRAKELRDLGEEGEPAT